MRPAFRRAASVAACSAAFVVVSAHPRVAVAQDTEATATALFDEGRKLMAQHHYADACPKLAESQRLAPSGGTLLNLAECYEHNGQTASAWAAWQGAAARANAAGKAGAEKSALARAAALEPSLARLTIAFAPGSDVSGIEVKRDGIPLDRGELGSALPIDPGSHVIEATAPKKKPWSTSVTVAARQTDARVTVALEDDVQAVAPAAPTPPTGTEAPAPSAESADTGAARASTGNTQRIIGVVVGAAGIVGLGVGTAFYFSAKSKNDEALQNCRTSTLCSPKGLSLTSDARSAATAATIALVAGGAAVAAGVVVWLTAPRSHPTTGLRLAPVVALSYGGLALDGAW
jgi:serine/threonine-protein kinase